MAFQRLRILLLPVLLASLLAGLGPAASPGETLAASALAQPVGSSVMVTATTLNVRKGPGTTYAIVDKVSQGTVLTILERNVASDWLKIETPRKILGWVASRFVTPISSGGSPAVPQRSASVGSQGRDASLPTYAGQPFGPNSATAREGTIVECFGAGTTPLRSVSANTPVQVIGVGDFAPPGDQQDKLGPGPYAKVRIWDGQYAWLAVNLLGADPNALPRTSSICEEWDRIDWSRVVRPTPVPYRSQPSAPGGGQTGCCKHCSGGKACGNTCIASYKTCHVGPGCACNG